jgi:hypothetical protein
MNGHKDAETLARAEKLMQSLSDQYIWDLYAKHKEEPNIRWKDRVKNIIGI